MNQTAFRATSTTCPCQTTRVNVPNDLTWRVADHRPLLDELRKLRELCPALNQVLIPGWNAFEISFANLAGDASEDCSIVFEAFGGGHLGRLTRPIHRFLMDGSEVKQEVTNQYRRDLTEMWTAESDTLGRHEHARMFLGRIVELLVAEWLDSRDTPVVGLEATGAANDVVCLVKGGEHPVEVKFIGTSNRHWLAMSAHAIWGSCADLDSAKDYLLFRLYEAACRLPPGGTAAIVIDDFTWATYRYLIRSGIDCASARFTSQDPNWLAFLSKNKERERFRSIESDLASRICSLGQVWVFRLFGTYSLCREVAVHPNTSRLKGAT